MRNKLKKFKWLSKLSDFTPSHVTHASDEDQQIKAPKTKKRKWIKKSKYQRIQKQKKKQKISVVFNYSKITLTSGMEKVLNRGLNFSITPLHLNLTQVLVDFARFERTMLWQEFWADSEKEEYEQLIFKKVKTNFPKSTPHHRV